MSFLKELEYNKDIDQDTQKAWSYANDYFTSEDPGKGIILMGTVGNGKTRFFREVLSKFYNDNRLGESSKRFTIMDAHDIVKDYAKNGYAYINNYQYAHPLVIDDLGSEPIGNSYGQVINVLEDLITFRYKNGLVTHFTTNLDKDELINKYGSRIMDRIREMCTAIHFSGTSLRK